MCKKPYQAGAAYVTTLSGKNAAGRPCAHRGDIAWRLVLQFFLQATCSLKVTEMSICTHYNFAVSVMLDASSGADSEKQGLVSREI